MTTRPPQEKGDEPLLYYRTKEEIETYKRKPVRLKLQWLEAQMEFFHKAMSRQAKEARDRLSMGESRFAKGRHSG